MKRSTVHIGFFVIAGASACFMAWQLWQIRQAERINNSVQSISAASLSDTQAERPDDSEAVRIQLKRASVLSRSGDASEAERLFGLLLQQAQSEDVRVIAQYNLANHYMRQALSSTVEANAVMPLVELAKQRYRDALEQTPEHWNARYNLEQALKMAPEATVEELGDDGEPIKSVDVIVPDFERGDLP